LLSYLILLANPNKLLLQVIVLALGSTGSVLGLIALRRPGDDARKKLLMLAAGAGLLIIAGLSWNTLFLIYIRTTGYGDDIFRYIMHNAHSPIYGRSAWSKWPWSLILVLFSGAFIARIINWPDARIESRGLAIELLVWFAGFILAFALSDSPERLTDTFSEYRDFALDKFSFEGFSHALSTYSQQMPYLSIHGGHYPPGNLLLVMVGARLGLSWLAHFVVICFAVLTFLPIAGITSELRLPTYTRNIALALFISSPAVLSIPSIDMTPIPMFFAATALWFALKAISKESYLYSVSVGVFMTAFSYFSYTSIIVWGLLTLLAAAQMLINKVRPLILLKTGAASAATFLLLCWVFYLATQFNIFVSLMNAIEHNRIVMASGYDSILRYLFRSTGNLIAWLFSIGFAASIFGIRAGSNVLRRLAGGNRTAAAFSAAVLCIVFLAAFSTLFFLETERVWLIFVPPWIVAAATAVGEVSETNKNYLFKTLLIFSILTVVGQELVFQPFVL
jgi:hypothetical protein